MRLVTATSSLMTAVNIHAHVVRKEQGLIEKQLPVNTQDSSTCTALCIVKVTL